MTEYSERMFVSQIARDGGLTYRSLEAALSTLDFRPFTTAREFLIGGTTSNGTPLVAKGSRLMTNGYYEIAEIEVFGGDHSLGRRVAVTMGPDMDDHVLAAFPADSIGRIELHECVLGLITRRADAREERNG